jgi:hypothetical protein
MVDIQLVKANGPSKNTSKYNTVEPLTSGQVTRGEPLPNSPYKGLPINEEQSMEDDDDVLETVQETQATMSTALQVAKNYMIPEEPSSYQKERENQ